MGTSYQSPSPPNVVVGSSRSQERFPNLQRPSVEGLLGRLPKIFLDFLRGPSPTREATTALLPPLRELANLLTRSWNEREQNYLVEILFGEAIISAQHHNHKSVLYMMSVADKVHLPEIWLESSDSSYYFS